MLSGCLRNTSQSLCKCRSDWGDRPDGTHRPYRRVLLLSLVRFPVPHVWTCDVNYYPEALLDTLKPCMSPSQQRVTSQCLCECRSDRRNRSDRTDRRDGSHRPHRSALLPSLPVKIRDLWLKLGSCMLYGCLCNTSQCLCAMLCECKSEWRDRSDRTDRPDGSHRPCSCCPLSSLSVPTCEFVILCTIQRLCLTLLNPACLMAAFATPCDISGPL